MGCNSPKQLWPVLITYSASCLKGVKKQQKTILVRVCPHHLCSCLWHLELQSLTVQNDCSMAWNTQQSLHHSYPFCLCGTPLLAQTSVCFTAWGRHTVAQLAGALRYKPEGHGFDSWWCHWNFLLTQTFWPHYGPGVDSVSNRNEYWERVKVASAYSWQPYHLHETIILKSGSVNLLKPSQPVQACKGIALPSLSFFFLPTTWAHAH
jgi:hypothetical protein